MPLFRPRGIGSALSARFFLGGETIQRISKDAAVRIEILKDGMARGWIYPRKARGPPPQGEEK